jgi:hypothetical protein
MKAEKLKVLKNEGNSASIRSRVFFDNVSIIPNLNHIAILIGDDEGSISNGLLELSRVVEIRPGETKGVNKKLDVMELEEKELEDEEEVDRVLLQNIYGAIMEEVMEVGGDEFVIPPSYIAKYKSRRKGGKAPDRKKVK